MFKDLFLVIALFITTSFSLFCESEEVINLVAQGVELNDNGKYSEAIEKFQEALKIDSNSIFAHYEMAHTLMGMAKYEEAISHCNFLIDSDMERKEGVYIIYASALDYLRRSDESIEVFEKAIKEYPDNEMIYFNMAITCFNAKKYEKAESSVIKAIEINPTHGTSHLLLGTLMDMKYEKVKSLLSYYFYLLIEPNSERSAGVLNMIKSKLKEGVAKDSTGAVQVLLATESFQDSTFRPIELFLKLHAAYYYTKENKEQSDLEIFKETNQSLFTMVAGLIGKDSNLWIDFYAKEFAMIVADENIDTFTYYISQSVLQDDVLRWMDEHPEKKQKFMEYLHKFEIQKRRPY